MEEHRSGPLVATRAKTHIEEKEESAITCY